MTANPPTTYRKLTAAEFFRLAEAGVFRDRRVELIGGEVVEMAAQGTRHTAAIHLVQRRLETAFGPGYWVRAQGTLDLSPHSMPDPDIAVVPGDPARPGTGIPTTALLIVEVSDTTLSHDRNRKASLYAAAGIADYWILNLTADTLEVRRDPQPDATQPFGHGYATLTTHGPADAVAPLAGAGAAVRVADVLPG